MLEQCWGQADGTLGLIAPDGNTRRLRGRADGLEGTLDIHDGAAFVRRLFSDGAVGFADSFIAGDWDSPDLAALLTVLSQNLGYLAQLLRGRWWLRAANALMHALNSNSRVGARRNITAHYDLGDAFYRLWLDPGLNYSSARFEYPGQPLAEAQIAKHRALADAMALAPGQTLLEIGCGWGDFAVYAASVRGARVTAVTISRAQHAYASRRVQSEGLADRVDVRLCDYRDVDGVFDRVASIEMFEAVGEAFWPVYFDKLREVLAPGGRAGLQVITLDEALFPAYRRRPDFIQLHVFPGGMLASEAALRREAGRVGLDWRGEERFGADYAATLAAWSEAYDAHASAVRALGFDARFDRMWRYYLAYCEAGFRTRRTDVIQLTLARG